ncbi:MAG: two-component system sensor histidine kinase PilS (NtrC family) [Gammaproteobacteria bacterium]|jgi:two-component system sensor histidine kinase PilS (NtrC family)
MCKTGLLPVPDQLIAEQDSERTLWRSLFYFNIYRVSLSTVLLLIAISDGVIQTPRYPTLFLLSAIISMVLAIGYFVAINSRKIQLGIICHFQTSADLLLISLLTHASTSLQSGFGVLMVISVASISLVGSKRSAIAYAAMGSLLSLLEQSMSFLSGHSPLEAFGSAGFLGLGMFTTAIIVVRLAERAKLSESIVTRQGVALASMDAINKLVVDRIPTGVIVVDTNDRVITFNNRARFLLKIDDKPELNLPWDFPQLCLWLRQHQDDPEELMAEFHHHGRTMHPTQVNLFNGRVIFLEDVSSEREQARQLRLAAMGRLAAAVAHEIRNPLSAIYQSGQLIRESDSLSKEDSDLVDIINKQCQRIDRTIGAVLDVSRGHSGEPNTIQMKTWLKDFVKQFCSQHDLDEDIVDLQGENISITMDSNHLLQVMTNLCENALAHRDEESQQFMQLITSLDAETHRPGLDVVDFGSGIPESHRNQLFEPFFTTRSSGTGLGLYITRELCEANQAIIRFQLDQADTTFNISFMPANE